LRTRAAPGRRLGHDLSNKLTLMQGSPSRRGRHPTELAARTRLTAQGFSWRRPRPTSAPPDAGPAPWETPRGRGGLRRSWDAVMTTPVLVYTGSNELWNLARPASVGIRSTAHIDVVDAVLFTMPPRVGGGVYPLDRRLRSVRGCSSGSRKPPATLVPGRPRIVGGR
jgi:hypothetical protein